LFEISTEFIDANAAADLPREKGCGGCARHESEATEEAAVVGEKVDPEKKYRRENTTV
jgi:hypothetical protein